MKRLSRLLCALLVLSLTFCTPTAAAQDSLDRAIAKAAAHVLTTTPAPTVASVGGDWAVLALARSDSRVPASYWEAYYARVEQAMSDAGGILDPRKYTEHSRVILALTAIGMDPKDVAGYDLLRTLADFDQTMVQGVNGPIWALLALDAGGYDIPTDTSVTTQAHRQMYVDAILSRQLADGGWALSGQTRADPDLTAMALQALSKYQEQSAVHTAIQAGLACLSRLQNSDGTFSSRGIASAESAAQVVVALCELGVCVTDDRFVKNGTSPLDALLSYQLPDGGFRHTAASSFNQMATEQALYALAAAQRARDGRSTLFRMDDVSTNAGLPGKDRAVEKRFLSFPGRTFSDIASHPDRAAILALAGRGIVSGKGDGRFYPDATMTRAEFCALVVNALGLPDLRTTAFSDVKQTDWFCSYVGTAYEYGIVSGKGGGRFDPNATITRQEAAVMVAAAARLCGMDTSLTAQAMTGTLARFSDRTAIAGWAAAPMAFCYGQGILDRTDLTAHPKRRVLRGEVAQMVYALLGCARLL